MPIVTTVVDAVIISYQQNLYIYQRTVFSYQKSDINRKSIVKKWLQQFSVIFLSCLMANEQQVLQTDCSCSRARSSRLSLFYYDYNQSQSRPLHCSAESIPITHVPSTHDHNVCVSRHSKAAQRAREVLFLRLLCCHFAHVFLDESG